jgi:DNA primase catalytic core
MTVGQGGAGGAGGRAPLPGDREKAAVAHLNLLAAQFYCDRAPGSWVPRYLEARGFSPAVQARWHAGYAPASWDALTRQLRVLGYADELIERAGLARQSQRGSLIDVFRDRAVLPIRSTTGTVTGFIGRARDARIAGAPKYLNTARTRLYDKSRLLFGLYEARTALAAGARPVIVEGPFDAIAVTAAGEQRFAGVGTCGTALTAQHIAALAQVTDLRAVGAVVGFDPDFAGQRVAVRAYHLLRTFTDKLDAVDLEDGQDPAGVLESQGPTALAETLADRTRPLADMVVDNEVERWSRWLCYPEGQVHALRAAARLIVAMPPSHVGRQVSRLASRLGFDHAVVTEAVTDALTECVAGTGAACSPRSRPRSSRSPPPSRDFEDWVRFCLVFNRWLRG